MASDLISRKALLQLLYEKWLNNTPNRTCFFLDGEIQRTAEAETIEKIMKEIEGMPAVEVIDVHSEIDINNEALSVSKIPESHIKKILARGLVEELEKYITVKKYSGMFHNTVFHARVDLVMWKGEEGD